MARHSISFLLVCLVSLFLHANTTFVELAGGATKCFLEEVPKDTLILGKFKLEDLNPPQVYGGTPVALGVYVKVTDPNGEMILEKVYAQEGRFALTSQVGGEHTLCFATNTSRWFGPAIRTVSHFKGSKACQSALKIHKTITAPTNHYFSPYQTIPAPIHCQGATIRHYH